MWIMAPIPPTSKVWTIDSSWSLQNSSLVYLGVEIRSLPFMARPPPDGSTISCDYSRIFCQPHLLQRPSGIVSWATYRPLFFSSLTGCSEGGCSSLASRNQWDFLDDQFQVPWFPLYREFFFSGGLEWPSCVKEYPSPPVQEVSFLSDASDVGCRPS